jgi:hypothetical protein
MTAAPPRARRRTWPWVVSIVVVLVLVVLAAVFGEMIARDILTRTVRQQVITQFALPADQKVDVEIPSPSLLLELAIGSIGEITVSSKDVPIAGTTGDVSVTMADYPVWGGGDASYGTATVTLTQEQLRTLMSTVDGFPADSLGLAAPDVTMTSAVSVLGASFPVGVALQPGAEDGDLVLTPASLRLGGATISADDLRARFGAAADAVLKDWDVCVKDSLPKGVVLTDVRIAGGHAVGTFEIDGAIARDPALQATGTCA